MKKKLITTIIAALTLAAAFTVQAADLHVPADYPTIQAAVDAASTGDTIHIAPGVYPGQTRIREKNLTLTGRPGTILRATPDLSPIDSTSVFPAVLGVRRSDVTLRDLTFEGEHMADVTVGQRLIGAYYWYSGGSVENCRFVGFRESSSGFSAALRFFNNLDNAPMVNVHVVGNTIVDSQQGIILFGAQTNPSITFSILDNTIIGQGPTTGEQPVGIRIGHGAGGEVRRNIISGFSYVEPQSPDPAWGILALPDTGNGGFSFLETIVIEGNTLRDNQGHLGIAAFAGGGTAVSSHLRGNRARRAQVRHRHDWGERDHHRQPV